MTAGRVQGCTRAIAIAVALFLAPSSGRCQDAERAVRAADARTMAGATGAYRASPGGARSLRHEDTAIQQALHLIGQPMSPVRVLTRAGPGLPGGFPGAGARALAIVAFRMPHDPNIYVIADSPVYRKAARDPSPLTLLLLAATLVHEQVHDTDGDHAAYRLQSDFVRSRMATLPFLERDRARLNLDSLESRAQAHARVDRVVRRPAHSP